MIREVWPVFPIYSDMEPIKFDEPKTKECPFCAEVIQAKAVKCRFCNEFLNTDKAEALQGTNPETGAVRRPGQILFAASPSLWAMAGPAVKGLLFLAISALLLFIPAEDTMAEMFGLSKAQAVAFGWYRILTGLAIAVTVVLILTLKLIWLRRIHYEVSADRIEYSRGIFDRKVDNLDMFRVIDLKLRRGLFDCIVGTGSVSLETTDKTDPVFTFKKIKDSRRLYDVIKKASLSADQKRSVIHLE